MNQLTFSRLKPFLDRSRSYRKGFVYAVSLLLIVNSLAATALSVTAQSSLKSKPSSTQMRSQSAVAVSLPNYPLKEGVHLFGRSRLPGQVQTEYLVFKMSRNRVVGAFFMPSSSFDCFLGTKEASKLKLTVVESYEQQAFEHSINLNQYYPIQQISHNDLRIVDACAAHSSRTAQEH